MDTFEIIKTARTGDVLLVKGEGFISKIIRSLTGESFSHVAMVCRNGDHIFVREFVEGKGFQPFPSVSLWLEKRNGQSIYYGVSPELDRDAVLEASGKFPFSKSYGYLSLFKVWWSQLRGKKFKTKQKVCSTFIQHCWEKGGFTFKETADPGDYMDLCISVHHLK